MFKNLFDPKIVDATIERINKLTPNSKPQWGVMDVARMLAHCNVAYQYTYEPEKFKRPGALKGFLLRKFVKKMVLSPKPYGKGSRTAPDFIIADEQDFEKQKETLIRNLRRTQQLGTQHFEGLKNFSFGKMTANEWNTLFSKHLDHHLTQFGV